MQKKQVQLNFSKNEYLPFKFFGKPCDYYFEFAKNFKNRICSSFNYLLDDIYKNSFKLDNSYLITDKDRIKYMKNANSVSIPIFSREDLLVAVKSSNNINVPVILDFTYYPIGLLDLITVPESKNNNLIYRFNSRTLMGLDSVSPIYLHQTEDWLEYYPLKDEEKCLISNIESILTRFSRVKQNLNEMFDICINKFNIICRISNTLLDIELAGVSKNNFKKILKKLTDSGLKISSKNLENSHILINVLPMTILGMDKIDSGNIVSFICTVCELMINRENSLSNGNIQEYKKYSDDLRIYIKDMEENLILPLQNKFKIKNFSFRKTS